LKKQIAQNIYKLKSGKRAINYLLNSEKFTYSNKDYAWPDLIFPILNMPAMNGWEL